MANKLNIPYKQTGNNANSRIKPAEFNQVIDAINENAEAIDGAISGFQGDVVPSFNFAGAPKGQYVPLQSGLYGPTGNKTVNVNIDLYPSGVLLWNGSSLTFREKTVNEANLLTKTEAQITYLEKEGFSGAIDLELTGEEQTNTYGRIGGESALTVNLASPYHWTSPLSVCTVDGAITSLSIKLSRAGVVRFFVGTASPTTGGFTVRRQVYATQAAVGINTFPLTAPVPISAGEIVAVQGDGTAQMQFGTAGETRDSRWIQQTETAMMDNELGWWPFSYTATGLSKSKLYDVFPTFSEVEENYINREALNDYPTKTEAVLKDNFDQAIETELEGTEVTETIGISAAGEFSARFTGDYHWTYPSGISHLTGIIDQLSVRMETAGQVTFAVGTGQYNTGGFTVRKSLGTFNAAVGLNTFPVNEEIKAGEIVAVQGDGATNILFGVWNGYGTRWVRQNAGGLLDSSVGWIPYSYRVTGLSRSALYNVFPTKTEVGEEYLSKVGFGDALAENVEGTEVTIESGKLSGSLTANLSQNRYHWTYPDNIATLDGDITELSVRLSTAGKVFFAIGSAQFDRGGFDTRKLVGPFDAATGLNTFPLVATEHIKTGEILALAMPTGESTTAVVTFNPTGSSKWVHQTATNLIDNAAGWWSVGYKMNAIRPSVLDERYVLKDNMGAALSDYLEKGAEYPPETIGDYGSVSGSVAGTAYIGNNLPFSSDGRIDTIRLNAPVAGTVVFAIGDIDQFGIFLEESTFSKSAVVGDNTFTNIGVAVRRGQVMLVKSSLATLSISTGGSYVRVGTAGDPITVVTGSSVTYNVVYTPIDAPVVASAEYVKALEGRVRALESTRHTLIFSTPGGFEYKITCNDDGTNIRSVSAWPSKGVHIGNSITRHPITSFWWGTQGMAATEHSKDYVHVLESLIKTKNPNFTGSPQSHLGWETAHVGFDYSQFDGVLTSDVDLVTLILGDNTQNLTGFENSCFEFLTYIRTRLPNATIICTDNWYYSSAKASAWKSAAGRVANVKYVSIASIRNANTEAGMGTLVWGDDGQQHAIDNAGVATHPGDSGMEAIANRLFQSI